MKLDEFLESYFLSHHNYWSLSFSYLHFLSHLTYLSLKFRDFLIPRPLRSLPTFPILASNFVQNNCLEVQYCLWNISSHKKFLMNGSVIKMYLYHFYHPKHFREDSLICVHTWDINVRARLLLRLRTFTPLAHSQMGESSQKLFWW